MTWITGETLASLERRAILECLAYNRGNRTATAAMLGISLRCLKYKLAEYGVKSVHEARVNKTRDVPLSAEEERADADSYSETHL